MSFLFGRNRARPSTVDLPKQARDSVTKLEKLDGPSGQAKADPMDPEQAEELAKTLSQMKQILQGTQETEATPEQVYQLVHGMIEEDLLYQLAVNLWRLPFEARKDTQVIFSSVFRFRPATASPKSDPVALSWVVNNRPQVLIELCKCYDHKESATPAGSVLREVLKSEAAAAIILYDDGEEQGSSAKGIMGIDQDRAQSGNGEILTKHKDIIPRYLAINFDMFFDKYNHVLVQSTSYVTKRQSIKLLGELLLDRSNYNIMTAYVDSGEHLKICMNLLRDDRKMVQYEGFHVFKVFVANPHKSVPVQKILLMNRDKLLQFLSRFLEDRTDDEQFIDEKEFLIKQIRNMPAAPVPPQR
ncbi:putative conidiophore development protein hyma [Diaporthe ampelina]|uniref:Putative conidiophore development protein hyma n=1 Tax=Diaporthe ampelina TaxID=1214573 RepID=A0A0G2H6J9_9PEZI|nr:putative conidiophore development protein hyma [Diaporthe ampelina]